MDKQELAKIKEVFERVTGERVRGICLQGSKMKGVADQSADNDIFVVIVKPFQQYAGIGAPIADRDSNGQFADSRKIYQHVANRVGMELGISVSFSVYDIRSMFKGIVEHNPFTAVVVKEMLKNGIHEFRFMSPMLPMFARRCIYVTEYLAAASKNISMSREDNRAKLYFRAEKRFVYALWNLFMAACVLNNVEAETVKIADLRKALMDWKLDTKYPEGLSADLEDVYLGRIERVTGTTIDALHEDDYADILCFYDALVAENTDSDFERPATTEDIAFANNLLISALVSFNYDEIKRLISIHDAKQLAEV